MAEYKQRVGIRQVDTRTGAASALRTLGDRLAQWQGDTGQFVQQQVSESIQKHRKSMIDGYDAGLNRDLREGLTRISSENPNNHEAYQQKAQAFVESTLGEIDEGYRGNFEEKSYALMDNYGNQVLKNNIALDRSNIKQSLSSSMETFKNDALRLAGEGDEESILEAAQAGVDFNTAANAMVNAGFITQAQADSEMKDLAKSSAEENFVGQIMEAGEVDIMGGYEKIDELSEKVPGGWEPQEWEAVLSRAQTQLNRKAARQAKLDDAQQLEIENANLLANGLSFLNEGKPLDPYGATDKAKYDLKSVNHTYDQVSKGWDSATPLDRIGANVEFVNATGVVPKALESKVNSYSRSGTPEQIMEASEIYARIQMETPQSIKDLPSETKAILSQVNEAVVTGSDPMVAIEAARKYAFGLTQQEKEAIKIKSLEFKKSSISTLQDQIDIDFEPSGFIEGILNDAPDSPVAMQAEFNIGFDKYMTLTNGSVEQASKLAYGDLKNTWGVTEVGGDKRFMKYSPEAIYGTPNADNGWISEQFLDDMNALEVEGAVIGINAHEASRQSNPTYQILVPDENGVLGPATTEDANGKAQIIKWRPDYNATEEFKDLEGEPGRKVKKAKEIRAIKTQRRFIRSTKKVMSRFSNSLRPTSNKITNPEHVSRSLRNAIVVGDIEEVEAKEIRKFIDWSLERGGSHHENLGAYVRGDK